LYYWPLFSWFCESNFAGWFMMYFSFYDYNFFVFCTFTFTLLFFHMPSKRIGRVWFGFLGKLDGFPYFIHECQWSCMRLADQTYHVVQSFFESQEGRVDMKIILEDFFKKIFCFDGRGWAVLRLFEFFREFIDNAFKP